MQRVLTLMIVALLCAALGWTASRAFPDRTYAQDRAEIDELFARYLFALDWQDPDMYGSVFAPDGVLVWAGGTVNGREAIVRELHNARAADQRARCGTLTASVPSPPLRQQLRVEDRWRSRDGKIAVVRVEQ